MRFLGRLVVWCLAIALCVLPLVALLNGWFASERWPLRHLRLTADYQRVDAEAVRAAVMPHLRGGFFAVSLESIHAAVAALDWVDQVEVRKQFPDRIELSIREHQPFATWGEDKLLSATGKIFPLPAGGAPAELPAFEADPRRVDEVVRVYGLVREAFAAQGVAVQGLRLSPRGSWGFRLDNGAIVMAGRGDPQSRVHRFAPLLSEVIAHDARPLERADLRYANGFALRWAEPAATSPTAPVEAPATPPQAEQQGKETGA